MDYADNRHTRRASSPEFAYNEKHEGHKPSVCYQPILYIFTLWMVLSVLSRGKMHVMDPNMKSKEA